MRIVLLGTGAGLAPVGQDMKGLFVALWLAWWLDGRRARRAGAKSSPRALTPDGS
jgi:hypothetical protein